MVPSFSFFFLSCLSFRGRSSGLCTCFSSQELFTSHACTHNRMFYGVVCAGAGSTCTEQPEHATKCSSEKANHRKTNKRWVKAQGLPFYLHNGPLVMLDPHYLTILCLSPSHCAESCLGIGRLVFIAWSQGHCGMVFSES